MPRVPGAPDPRTTRLAPIASIALGASLATLVVGRWLAEAGPSREPWGLDFARALDPWWRYGPWLLGVGITALAALPGVAAAIHRASPRLAGPAPAPRTPPAPAGAARS